MFNKRAIGFCYTIEPVIVTDIDGNDYRTVDINGQRWITSNLMVTHYADGTDIPNLILNTNDTYADWFLPSKDELSAMYTNLHLEGVGGFNLGNYWSSSEVSAGTAWGFNFALGSASNSYMKSVDHLDARACRSFTTTDIYALRDIGPAGGLIFSITNNGGGSFTYLECSPTVTSTAVHYSNIEALIGATAQGTAVGTGQTNTTAIISQALHTASAAKDCDDLSISVNGWIDDTAGAMCWYNNDRSTYDSNYGALYNWYAIDNIAGFVYLEIDGVPDTGWRVPTDLDYGALNTYLGGTGPMKEMGTSHWSSPNTGATNSSGLSLRGSGIRDDGDGTFYSINQICFLWTTTENGVDEAWCRGAVYTTPYIASAIQDKNEGAGIRLVKDL